LCWEYQCALRRAVITRAGRVPKLAALGPRREDLDALPFRSLATTTPVIASKRLSHTTKSVFNCIFKHLAFV
jgi:hypothetical protein